MACKLCNASSIFDFCNVCRQTSRYLDKYPGLRSVLDEDSLRLLEQSPTASVLIGVGAVCRQCGQKFRINLVSLLKQLRRNLKQKNYCQYRCHRCSKTGKSGVNVDTVKSVIDLESTKQKFGGLPKNVKNGKVVAVCEDCRSSADIKLSSLLHQARRHKLNGRSCVYKCLSCGMKRQDAVAKSDAARAKQLVSGFRSGIEIATENRLSHLGIEFVPQFSVGHYVWDFYLPKYGLLIDVNGEYWHSLPRNVSKDKAKVTYTQRHHPQYQTLVIQEKHFLNPTMVDKIILASIGQDLPTQTVVFELSDVQIRRMTSKEELSECVHFLNSYHYAMHGRHGKAVYGAFVGEKLIAICKFNSVVRKEVASSMKLKCHQVLELDRFCIHPSYQKKNLASWFISRCVLVLFREFPGVTQLVSFADETFGHSGTIYKAANWAVIGKTRHSYHYMDHLGVAINKKRVYDIASKLRMTEREYADRHDLVKYDELPKIKFGYTRSSV